MSHHTPLTDAVIEAALARCAARVDGRGLRDDIMAAVARTPQARRPLVARPEWLAWPARSSPIVRVVAVAGLLLALLAGSLIVASRVEKSLPRHPAALVPTGVETLAPEGASYGAPTADSTGMLWSQGVGVLARLDPASGAVRTWSFADDAAFGIGSDGGFAPAQEGGVWLLPGADTDQPLRWFDGERFRDVVPAPPGRGCCALAESPDGSLWSGTDTGLYRWDGTSWSSAPGRPAEGVAVLAIDRSGALWVGSDGRVSRYDGAHWETFTGSIVGSDGAPVIGGGIRSIAVARDGSVWVSSQVGLARYDGHDWTLELPATTATDDQVNPGEVTATPDGAVWVTCAPPGGWVGPPCRKKLARFDGAAWVVYGAADGLTAGYVNVAAVPDGVYANGDDGLLRLVGDRWERAWGSATPRPRSVSRLVGVSQGEAWALDDPDDIQGGVGTVWHYAGGAWSEAGAALPAETYDLARTADGTVLAATGDGVAVWREGQWTLMAEGPAQVVAAGTDGTAWSSGPGGGGGEWQVRGFRLDDPTRELSAIPGPPLTAVESLAVGADGSIWAGQARSVWDPGTTPLFGLFRYRDGHWGRVIADPLVKPDQRGVDDIEVAPNGDVWVIWQGALEADGQNWGDWVVARYDGSAWTLSGRADGLATSGGDNVAVAPDGTVWVADGLGLSRFDGARWTTVARGTFNLLGALSVAPDGTVFVTGPSGVARVISPGP